MPTISLDGNNTRTQLNIASEITRIRDAGNQRKSKGTDPYPVETLIANCLTALQANDSTVQQKLRELSAAVAVLQASHVDTTTLDQSANQLVFSVRYPDGTIKTGTVNLV